MNGYAILGWGSLIWDLENLAPHVRGDWAMGVGPILAMEFNRVSAKRNGALVVCLDAAHGVDCATHVIPSIRDNIDDVISDLSQRERAKKGHIGAVCLASGHGSGANPEVVERVRRWCLAEDWTGAVWTDLPTNFKDDFGQVFSVPRAISYLRTLTGDSLDQAVRYIENAPAATDTPLRRALAAEAWWRAEVRRINR